jgi:hypothetical protein
VGLAHVHISPWLRPLHRQGVSDTVEASPAGFGSEPRSSLHPNLHSIGLASDQKKTNEKQQSTNTKQPQPNLRRCMKYSGRFLASKDVQRTRWLSCFASSAAVSKHATCAKRRYQMQRLTHRATV